MWTVLPLAAPSSLCPFLISLPFRLLTGMGVRFVKSSFTALHVSVLQGVVGSKDGSVAHSVCCSVTVDEKSLIPSRSSLSPFP